MHHRTQKSVSPRNWFLRGIAFTTLVASPTFAEDAPNAAMRYAAVDLQRDSDDNSQMLGTLSLTAGDHWWFHGTVGRARLMQGSEDDTEGERVNPTVALLGVGVAGEQLRFSFSGSRYKSGDEFNQRDLNAMLEWHNEVVTLGLDGMRRNNESHYVSSFTLENGNIATVPVAQEVSGNGFGAHVVFNLNDHWSMGLGGMKYDYTTETRQDGTAEVTGNNNPVWTQILNNWLQNNVLQLDGRLQNTSLVTRDQALLDRSLNASLTYQWSRASLTAQYFNDRAYETEQVTHSYQLVAGVMLNDHWLLMPGLGTSRNDELGTVSYGMLSASYNW